MTAATSFPDEDTNPDALHPAVIAWVELMASAARKSEPPEVVADFERLLAMAKGGAR